MLRLAALCRRADARFIQFQAGNSSALSWQRRRDGDHSPAILQAHRGHARCWAPPRLHRLILTPKRCRRLARRRLARKAAQPLSSRADLRRGQRRRRSWPEIINLNTRITSGFSGLLAARGSSKPVGQELHGSVVARKATICIIHGGWSWRGRAIAAATETIRFAISHQDRQKTAGGRCQGLRYSLNRWPPNSRSLAWLLSLNRRWCWCYCRHSRPLRQWLTVHTATPYAKHRRPARNQMSL
jgi:hypothetical protein